MRHIEPFSLDEARAKKGAPSGVKPISFILYFGSRWYYGAFPTYHDFACKVYEDFIGDPPEDRGDPFFADIQSLKDELANAMSDYGSLDDTVSNDIDGMCLWWGMTSKCPPNTLFDHYCNGNPYSAARIIDSAFSGAKDIMDKWQHGRDADAGFIGLSIQNEPSQLESYLDQASDDTYFSKEDIIRSIPADSSKEILAMAKYHKIKGLI